jgi:uncharacterized repeat protein (TIGR03803 family)
MFVRLKTIVLIAGATAIALASAAQAEITYKQLYAFTGNDDGANPESSLIDVGGTFYGITSQGGGGEGSGLNGTGTVYKITPSGKESVIHSFIGGSDGASPQGDLLDVGGVLYGTTSAGGGTGCGGQGCGTVFRITTDGTESVVYAFQGGTDGANPAGGLYRVGNTLFGTTTAGGGTGCGGSGCGTVFKLASDGSETVFYAFQGPGDGEAPIGDMILVDHAFYGITAYGGITAGNCQSSGCGTVFKITTSGQESVLYAFKGGTDGRGPRGGLADVGGAFYGVTFSGGANSAGTVYEVTPSGQESVLHTFGDGSDGQYPVSQLLDIGGTLYGTTTWGGTACRSCGTVYSITPSGQETVLYSFLGPQDADNAEDPVGRLLKYGPYLYGAASAGGSVYFGGAVYRITP